MSNCTFPCGGVSYRKGSHRGKLHIRNQAEQSVGGASELLDSILSIHSLQHTAPPHQQTVQNSIPDRQTDSTLAYVPRLASFAARSAVSTEHLQGKGKWIVDRSVLPAIVAGK